MEKRIQKYSYGPLARYNKIKKAINAKVDGRTPSSPQFLRGDLK